MRLNSLYNQERIYSHDNSQCLIIHQSGRHQVIASIGMAPRRAMISVIIPTHNEARVIAATLEHLFLFVVNSR